MGYAKALRLSARSPPCYVSFARSKQRLSRCSWPAIGRASASRITPAHGVQPKCGVRINRIDRGSVAHYGAPVLNFNHLYYFHVTAAEGSIKAAADRLGVTQPTVSEQLRMLERALGVELFDRTPTGLKLTQAGRQSYEHTSAMFLAGERLVKALGREVDPPDITLRIGISASMARTIAADFLMPVLTVEGCRPSIRTGDFHDMLRDVRSRELDLVVGETEPAEISRSDLAVELVYRPTLVAIVLPEIEPLPDWNNLALLEYRASSVYHWEVEKYLDSNGLKPSVMGEVDDAFLMLEAVLRGGFVAFVPRSMAREAIRQKKVKALLSLPTESAGVYAVYPGADSLPMARAAVERLIENARAGFDGT
jgi:LysR family transcriptional regulator, transcriptional activator of nhaA